MFENNPKTSGYVTAHFIAADSASFTKVLQYPPPLHMSVPLTNFYGSKEFYIVQFREYRLESYKFSKFGRQSVAIYREALARSLR